jgi:hypothetical protein
MIPSSLALVGLAGAVLVHQEDSSGREIRQKVIKTGYKIVGKRSRGAIATQAPEHDACLCA